MGSGLTSAPCLSACLDLLICVLILLDSNPQPCTWFPAICFMTSFFVLKDEVFWLCHLFPTWHTLTCSFLISPPASTSGVCGGQPACQPLLSLPQSQHHTHYVLQWRMILVLSKYTGIKYKGQFGRPTEPMLSHKFRKF